MLKDILSIRGSRVLHQKTGDILAYLNWPIINPDTGVIEAFWVKSISTELKDSIILTSGILAFKKNIYIASEKNILDPVEVVRITEILKENRYFINATVKNELGKSHGKVFNLIFSTETFVVRQLYATHSIFGLFKFDQRFFPYDKVIRVLLGTILVDDDSTEKESLPAPAEPA